MFFFLKKMCYTSITKNHDPMLETFRSLYKEGWMPVPVHVFLSRDESKRHKRPPLKWKPFADDPSSYDFQVIESYITQNPNALGVAVLTGLQRDGTHVISVDLDPPEDGTQITIPDDLQEALGSALVTRTPSGGYHFYFRYSSALHLNNKANLYRVDKTTQTAVDIRAEGGLSVMGPTALWKWNYIERSGKWRKSTPHSVTDRRYQSTTPPPSPSELPLLPQSIIEAFTTYELQKLNQVHSSAQDVKRLYENVLTGTPPDKEKGETLHGTLLSWSYKLISTYLPNINTPQDAEALFNRFTNDIQPLISSSTTSREITPDYLSKLFYSGLHKLKKNRDINYKLSAHLIDPLLQQRQADQQQELWSDFQITKIINYSTHLFATNDDQTSGFDLSQSQFPDQRYWRAQHLLHFGAPHLPQIKPKAFEQILASLTFEVNHHSLPHNTARIILDGWVTNVMTLEDEDDYQKALTQAIHTGRGGYLNTSCSPPVPILIFKLTALQTALRNEGYGTLSIPRLSQVLNKLKIKPIKENQSLYICHGT